MFTPVEGGEFVGAGFGISAGPGVVPDGDYIGIAMVKTGLASNVGQPHHRYTLAGDSYDILAIDSAMQRVTGYALASPAEACIPLPDRLRPNISDVALAASDNSGSMTTLASTVKVTVDGMAICGNLSELPATISAANVGSQSDFLTTSPVPESELPDTGGSTPSSSRAML